MDDPFGEKAIALPTMPSAIDMHRIIEEVRRNAERQANYAARPIPAHGVVDELKELVNYGDIIIRKVGNGWVIRKVPSAMMQGGLIETWVVEGDDIKLVGDQLTAIQANDAIRAGQNIPAGPARTVPSGQQILQAGMALDAASLNIAIGKIPR